MSMISAQIDELRAMARLEKSLERPAIARIFDDAADTIWQLRDDLQRANAENAKLRKILADACTYLCLVKMSGPLAVEIDKHNVYWDGEKILDRMLDLGVEVDDA